MCGDLIGKLRRGAIECIPDNGVTDGGHVNANLMSTAGFNAYAHQGELAESGVEATHYFVMRDSGAGVVSGTRGHSGAANGVTTDGGIDRSLLSLDGAVHQCDVGLADLTRGKEIGERGVGGVVLGNDDEAAGVLVEAVDDAGAKVAAGCRKCFESKEQRVDESIAVTRIFTLPAPACTIMPAGLLTTAKCLSSKITSSGMSWRSGFEGRRVGFAGDDNLFATAELE